MQVPVIKYLVENYSAEQLAQAEDDLIDEVPLAIEVEGVDEGEQLTHIMAARWILHDMDKNQTAFPKSMRAFSLKVRNSID